MIDELRFQLNRLNNELIFVKTKQEQYQTFITNALNRKKDIQDKIIAIENDLLIIEPQIQDFKNEREQQVGDLQEFQDRFNEISEILTEKSASYNQGNLGYHQQQNKVSNINKDLEFRETQQEDFQSRIERNTKDLEEVQLSLKNTAQFVDEEDQDLVEMYTQKDALEKGLEELEKSYYGVRKQINELEEQIIQYRRSKEQDDLLISEIKDKKTALQIDLNTLKERLSAELILN
ncbi:hypothetical protein [Sphingobacterium sp. IITKGP-BTPF85]|uniref:hypothetical protein n=1 Tax=Sphingobacterium sp. IITKGP-BTPF85 TaxID=1338009 RepID=UPI0003F698D9|nr:hypothetical protein [Sphingobacterium sp. IITKGP-BTPF85]KKX51998.1 hypothetical protein L950_0202390 [Sphingobacterium sp. IITKGP-BTPF85]